MKQSFSMVIEYVKNLFPGCAPAVVSDNPQLDARVGAALAPNSFYLVAKNGHRYWYCPVANTADMQLVQRILRDNGVVARKHNSRYFYGKRSVLRVRRMVLEKNPGAAEFVKNVMAVEPYDFKNDYLLQNRLMQLRQKVK